MYIIEFNERWVKKDGKLSFCKVVLDKDKDDDVSEVINEYVSDLRKLIDVKIDQIKANYKLNDKDLKSLKELVDELANVSKLVSDKLEENEY